MKLTRTVFENKYTDPLEINFFEKKLYFYGVDPTFINPPTDSYLYLMYYINKNIQMKKVDLEFVKIGSQNIFQKKIITIGYKSKYCTIFQR